jgi:hypothetical protein
MKRHPILTIAMLVFGVILLLPGICALGFVVAGGLTGPDIASLIGLWAICFLISAGGVLLLYKAFH